MATGLREGMMKTVKLALIEDGQSTGAEVHGSVLSGSSDGTGTTYICGKCDKAIVEDFASGVIEMVGVDLVCQHCGAHNYLDTTKT